MKYFSIILLLLFSFKLSAQVTATPGYAPTQLYDSSFNFDRHRRELLIGQQVYFIPYSEKYTGDKPEFSDKFISDPSELLNNPGAYSGYYARLPANCVYRPVLTGQQPTTYQTPLNQVSGRYFIVTDFEENNSTLNNNKVNLMELCAAENRNDMLYFRLDGTREFNLTGIYDFIVVGYYEKLKQKHINEYYYLISNNTLPVKDVITGELISVQNNYERWQCVDVTLLETSSFPKPVLSLLLKNNKGKTIAAAIEMPFYINIKLGFFEALSSKEFISEKEYLQQQKLNKQKQKANIK